MILDLDWSTIMTAAAAGLAGSLAPRAWEAITGAKKTDAEIAAKLRDDLLRRVGSLETEVDGVRQELRKCEDRSTELERKLRRQEDIIARIDKIERASQEDC